MNPIVLLKELSLLKGNRTVLDVGSKDGFVASQFATLGMEVDAIDIHDLEKNIEGIHFKKISVEEFLEKNEKRMT